MGSPADLANISAERMRHALVSFRRELSATSVEAVHSGGDCPPADRSREPSQGYLLFQVRVRAVGMGREVRVGYRQWTEYEVDARTKPVWNRQIKAGRYVL